MHLFTLERLFILALLLAVALAGYTFLRERIQTLATATTERVERIKVSL